VRLVADASALLAVLFAETDAEVMQSGLAAATKAWIFP